MAKIHEKLDAKEVLTCLNTLGYTNIDAQYLKEFIKDLKKLIKHEQKNLTQKEPEGSDEGVSHNEVRKEGKVKVIQGSTADLKTISSSTGFQLALSKQQKSTSNVSKNMSFTQSSASDDLSSILRMLTPSKNRKPLSDLCKLFNDKPGHICSAQVYPITCGSTKKQTETCEHCLSDVAAQKLNPCFYPYSSHECKPAEDLLQFSSDVKETKDPNKKKPKQAKTDTSVKTIPHSMSCCSTSNLTGGQSVKYHFRNPCYDVGALRPRSAFIKCPMEFIKKKTKCDPVTRYKYYQNQWSKHRNKIPDENKSRDARFRWCLREKITCGPPVIRKLGITCKRANPIFISTGYSYDGAFDYCRDRDPQIYYWKNVHDQRRSNLRSLKTGMFFANKRSLRADLYDDSGDGYLEDKVIDEYGNKRSNYYGKTDVFYKLKNEKFREYKRRMDEFYRSFYKKDEDDDGCGCVAK